MAATPPASPPLAQLTGFLLRRAYVKSAACARACISDDDTPIREVAILSILAGHGSLSQRSLADLTHVNQTTIVKLVDSLERKGWARRERNRDDRRSYALRLTKAGERALAEFEHDLDRGEQALTGSLTDRQRSRLQKRLRELLDGEDSVAIGSLADRTGFLVAQAHRRVRSWAIKELEPLGLDPRDFGVLSTLGREQPCSQNHLAHQLGVSPPAALMFVEGLGESGLVSKERNADDRRFYDLTLTAEGKRSLAAAARSAEVVQAKIVALLGERGDAELRRLLTNVIAP
ncbi:MAG: MarR family transcriptional regulator [Nocardioidaceae bacterium]